MSPTSTPSFGNEGSRTGLDIPEILISPSSPDQIATETNRRRVSRPSTPTTTTTTATRKTTSPKIPGSLSLDSPTSSTQTSPPNPSRASTTTLNNPDSRPHSTSRKLDSPSTTTTTTTNESASQSSASSFFQSIASSFPSSTSVSFASISSLLLPSKLSLARDFKLTKVSESTSHSNPTTTTTSKSKPKPSETVPTTQDERGIGRKSARDRDEETSESDASASGNESKSESESESESEDEHEREQGDRYERDGIDRPMAGMIRESMDLQLEEATTGPSAVQDTPCPPNNGSQTATATPASRPQSTLHRTPSVAFRDAARQGPIHPLTLQAIRRQDSEREALRVVEEMGAEFKRRDTIPEPEREHEYDHEQFGLGRIRSESPTRIEGYELEQEQDDGVRQPGAVERGREDSQSTVKAFGRGLPPMRTTVDSKRSVSTASNMTTTSTKTKKSFFARFKKDKSSASANKSNASLLPTTSSSIPTLNLATPLAGASGVKRSGSMASRAGTVDSRAGPVTPGLSVSETEGFIAHSGKTEKIRYPKVRTKGKSGKDFNKLFLAQELHLPPPPSSAGTKAGDSESIYSLHENVSMHSVSQDPSQSSNPHATAPTTIANPSSSADDPPMQQDAGRRDSKSKPAPSSSGPTPGVATEGEGNKKSKAIWAAKFSNNGKWLAVGGRDGVVRVWQVVTTPEEREHAHVNGRTRTNVMPVFADRPIREYRGHKSDVLDLNWSKNDFLLSSSMDKTVRLWHIDRDECLCSFEHLDFVTSIAFHPKDDRFFLSGSLDCKLRLWNIVEKRVQVWTELPELITAVSFTRDGQYAIAGSFVGQCMFFEVETFRFYDVFTAKSSKRKEHKGKKITSLVMFPLDEASCDDHESNDNHGLEHQPDTRVSESLSERLLVTSNDSHMRLYNTKGRFIEAKYSGHENTSSQIRASFSDDGKYVISGSEDRHVYIWDSAITKNSFGDFEVVKKRSEGAGFETFSMSAHIVTAALFAPTIIRSHLAQAGDPIFADPDAYPHLDPLPRSATRSSVGAASNKSDKHEKKSKKKDAGKGIAAQDMIVVVADAETGTISIFRNSNIPAWVLTSNSTVPPSATASTFSHAQTAPGWTKDAREKRWSRASASSTT
ncbi:WD40 repeat domain-containing protein [Sporobolomyces koalae]|uniref:WD40 repeat domain-containing protein n=1 Tax=Sporobolomyces koalae TaxID=500713 RepID=UPI00316C3757